MKEDSHERSWILLCVWSVDEWKFFISFNPTSSTLQVSVSCLMEDRCLVVLGCVVCTSSVFR